MTDTAGDVSVLCVVGSVEGVTQLHDVVYIVCGGLSKFLRFNATTPQPLTEIYSSAILRFNATTHQRLTDIVVKGLILPRDIVCCERTSQVYVVESDYGRCIWRVSSDGEDIQRWLPKSPLDTFKPERLSVTSTRLLVTSHYPHQLIQFDAVGDELRRVQLPYMCANPQHAVESPTGTFIVSHLNRQLCQVSEVNTGGEVLRQFSGSHLLPLGNTQHVAVDSHGNIFLADTENRCILLLDAHLTLRRVIVDKHQLSLTYEPRRLCYKEQSGQLLVMAYDGVAVFDVLG